MILNDATFIIRSANERTKFLCEKLVLDQGVNKQNLFTINEIPFSSALRKSYEIGIKQDLTWTLCVDADVLLRPGSVEFMLNKAKIQNKNVFEIQGLIMDKYFGGPRRGGIHLYRTSLLEKAKELIPAEGINIRPERYLLEQMKESGYRWKQIPYVVGIHDYEQFNIDIYRKALVQSVKHLYRAELFISLWRNMMNADHDFKVAIRGFVDGIQNSEKLFIDSSQRLYKDLFKEAGFNEKEPLSLKSISLDDVEKIINSWEHPDIYFKFFPNRDGLNSNFSVILREVKKSIRKRGFLKTLPLAVGEFLLNLGKRIKRFAENA